MIFNPWCDCAVQTLGLHKIVALREKSGARQAMLAGLGATIRGHYEHPATIADDIKRLGMEKTASLLRAELPKTKRGRSGDFGEILATEYVNEQTQFRVPINRLRYKDGRELALRGDDIVGILVAERRLKFLKGEAKSRDRISATTVKEAREALESNKGRPSSYSLNFVAKRLLEKADAESKDLGRMIRDTLAERSVTRDQIRHLIFTVSGNGSSNLLKHDLEQYRGSIPQELVDLITPDHPALIARSFREAANVGNR
jgi:hypothetical protein